MFFLGLYRLFYVVHWYTMDFIDRINNWDGIVLASFLAGIVQTILYADFIYYFVKSNQN